MTPLPYSGPKMLEAMRALEAQRAAIRAQLQEAAYQAAKPEEFRELDKALGEMMRHIEELEGEGGEDE